MQAWQVAVLVLSAVIVGAALPLVVQLWRTLASYQRFMDAAAPRLTAALEDVHEMTKTVHELRSSMRVAAALGAAVAPTAAAFVRGLRAPGSNGHKDVAGTVSDTHTKEVPHD